MKKISSLLHLNVAFRTVVIYLTLSIVWILLSDTIVFNMPLEKETMESIQKIKGLIFVGLSTVVLYLVVHSGITRQERIFSELIKSEERFHLFINSISDYAIFMLDPSGNIVSWNNGAETMTGYSGSEIVGKHFSVFYTTEALAQNDPSTFLLIARERGEHQEESQKVRKDGSTFWADSLLYVVWDTQNSVQGYAQVLRDISERRRTEEKEKKYHEQLLILTDHLQTSVEEERARISREIHDDLAQRMTVLRMDIALLSKSLEPVQDASVQEIVKQELPAMTAMIDESIQSVRKIIRDLRPEVLDSLGLQNSLSWLADEFARRTDIPVNIQLPNESITFTRETSTTLFRIFQEALSNIGRHSHASRVNAELSVTDNTISFTVQDNGKGISVEEINKLNSFGLLGMRERVRALGGTMSIKGEKDRGTILAITIPFINPAPL